MPRMTIRGVRGAFLAIFQPSAMGDGDPAYGGRFIIPKDHPQIAEIEAAMLEAATVQWKEKAKEVLDYLKEEDKVCFHRKEYKNKKGEVYNGFEGAYYVGARNGGDNPTKPSAFNASNTKLEEPGGLIYSGAYFDVSVDIYAQDNKFGRRINASLRGLRFAKHGDAFGGGAPASADEFGEPQAEGEGDFV